MTDCGDLIKRLLNNDLSDNASGVPCALCREAAERLERQAEQIKHHDYYRGLYKEQHERDKAKIERQAAEIERLQKAVNSGASYYLGRLEKAEAEIERLREELQGIADNPYVVGCTLAEIARAALKGDDA